jgi:FixJ family two-component response regulator
LVSPFSTIAFDIGLQTRLLQSFTEFRQKLMTVQYHRARVFVKLNLDSLAGLVRYAIRNRLAEP